jgi:large subunit ribosomal protein L6
LHIFTKMKKEIIKKIEIPQGVEVEIEGSRIVVKGNGKENSREFKLGEISLEKKENSVVVWCKDGTKNEKKVINTFGAHIKNLMDGIVEDFKYELKICFVHFPITVEINGNEALIKNFLGEKTPRKCSIPNGVKAELNKEIITITSHNKELAGQAAANFEKATRIRLRDRRIFQDGIFIITKNGKEM